MLANRSAGVSSVNYQPLFLVLDSWSYFGFLRPRSSLAELIYNGIASGHRDSDLECLDVLLKL